MTTLLFDTETTALINNSLVPIDKQPKIIELFLLILNDDFTEKAACNFLFNPGEDITEEITKITGITNEMLKDQKPFKDAAPWIGSAIESVDEVVAHNLSFDKAMIDNEMARQDIKLKWPALICTVENTEYIRGFRMKLSELHEYLFGEGFLGAHRAEQDVRAMAKCFVELRKRGIV